MQALTMGMHHKTPRLSAIDPRGLPIRSVDYWREVENVPTQARINRTFYDCAGRAVEQWDPRLWALKQEEPLAPANLMTVFSLSGNALFTDSVDAGWQLNLSGLGNEVLLGWDSRGTHREVEYDDLLRPVSVFEQGGTEPSRCVERMAYGDPDHSEQNQCGQLIRLDDPAGTVLFEAFSITRQCVKQVRHFTLEPVIPDWPALEADRQRLLEPGEGAASMWNFGPLNDVLEKIDAKQNRQDFHLTLDGRLRESRLQLQGQTTWQTLVSDIQYNAEGQVTHETAGNDVETTLLYRAEDGLLMERRAHDASARMLQHLIYDYDRTGNVLSIEDKALPVRHFANQRIEPISRFSYDSLYQLIEAFGWEAGTANQGPASVGRVDPAAVSNYHQVFSYDQSGNLLKLIHVGAQNHGRDLQAARFSNRCLPWRNGVPPGEDEIAAAFDAKGNLLELDPGRFLMWDLRNQLQSVSPVERTSGDNDWESYVYDGGGQRVRKIRSLNTNARTVAAEVRYLPGLEIRTDSGTGKVLQVITAQAGLNSVRVLHWETDPPSGVTNDQYRYSLVDHLNSCTLELADDARIISWETYHPFGTTAWSAGPNATDGDYKTVRYSGKERDATGLYYYGFRYYIPWLQRWLNPDPAGVVDGLNLYRMVRNSPLTFFDELGKEPQSKSSLTSATGIFDTYKEGYSDTDRNLPFKMMADITDNKLNFKTAKASPGMLEKTQTKRFTLRHYSVAGSKGDAPPFMEIASNFSLVHKNVKTLGGKGGNTNEKDWTKAGNSAFTFFLLAVDGEVNERRFLNSMTHFAEYDIEDDKAMEAGLGTGFKDVEFFASPDVLDPKHSSNLATVPMVKGRLKDLKSLLLGNSGISPVQLGRMDSRSLLNSIDGAFGGSLEIKIPGTIKVKTWNKKTTTSSVGKMAA
ncbi:RHS repeat domain-containing protein [Pseudomonas sp. ZS1P83]